MKNLLSKIHYGKKFDDLSSSERYDLNHVVHKRVKFVFWLVVLIITGILIYVYRANVDAFLKKAWNWFVDLVYKIKDGR